MRRLETLRVVLGIVALAVVVIGAVRVLWPFVAPILWAMILGTATWPAHRRLRAWFGKQEGAAALTMTIVLVVVVVVPAVFLGLALAREIQPTLAAAEAWAATGQVEIPEWCKRIPGAEAKIESWLALLGNQEAREVWLKTVLPVEVLFTFSRKVLHNIVVLLLTIFTLYFVYRDGEKLADEVSFLLDRIAGGRGWPLLNSVRQTVRAVFFGWLMTAAAQGLVAMLGYWIVGLHAPVLLGVATALAAVIPFGVGLVWIPAVASLALMGLWGKAIFLAIWSLACVGLIDNFLRPLFISGPSKVPFVLVFFGIMGGLLVFGLLGLVLGPVFLAVLLALWRQGREALLEAEDTA